MMELSCGKHESKQESIISLFLLLVSVLLELYWTYIKIKLSFIEQLLSRTGVIHDKVNARNVCEVSFNTAHLS